MRLEDYTGERLGIYLVDGKELKERPLARIYLNSPFIKGRVVAEAMKALGADLYIGNSATLEGGDNLTISVYPRRELLVAVQTRAHKEREKVKDAPPKVVTVRGLDITLAELHHLQDQDPTLDPAERAAERGVSVGRGANSVRFKKD